MRIEKKYKSSYLLNAADGTVTKNGKPVVNYRMPPYGSIILYAGTKANSFPKTNGPVIGTDQDNALITLSKWDLKTDSLAIKDTSLFDWRTNSRLKFSSAEGVYTSSFNWSDPAKGARYFLDLGKVYYTAEVYVNGKYAGKRVFAPYMLDVTSLLQKGSNNIEVRVTTGQLNGFIGNGDKGDARYKQFKNKDDQLMATGLIGPVVIRKVKQ